MRALCASRPADWWETGDEGNRLALLLCGVCPQKQRCASTAVDEHGVIRAGVAYGDDGKPLPICRCGYPNRHRQGWRNGYRNPLCHRCKVPPHPRRWGSRQSYWAAYYKSRRAA